MIEGNCEQQAREKGWDLAEVNACHISVMNQEMGQLRNAQLKQNIYMQGLLWEQGLIAAAIIGLVIKKMWGSNNSSGSNK